MNTAPETEVPKLLTTIQAARLLKLSPQTLVEWRKQRKHLPFIHLGGQVRYHLSEVQKLLAVGTSTPRPHHTRSPAAGS